MKASKAKAVLCNGADIPEKLRSKFGNNRVVLEYRENQPNRNVRLLLHNFVKQVHYVPPRLLDLLELATYVFCADRMISRGDNDQLEYHGWSRRIHVFMKVRNIDFWRKRAVRDRLSKALQFMSGDREWVFHFAGGHSTPPSSLFDRKEFLIKGQSRARVMLFSGGLDSLAGAVELLARTNDSIFLVSHRSSPQAKRTQNRLFSALEQRHHRRLYHCSFECSLKGERANEETQRTRSFIYCAVAFVLANLLDDNRFLVFENGITSVNIPRRQDAMNARASRTTHPKALFLMTDFLKAVAGGEVQLETPFLWKTKADIFELIRDHDLVTLISSSVSCSRTRNTRRQTTHCGGCFQCVDRRFAAYASGCDDADDAGIYSSDFVTDQITDDVVRTTVIDYVRQAHLNSQRNLDSFYGETLSELGEITDAFPDEEEYNIVEKVYQLYQRHGKQVQEAVERMRQVGDVFGKPAAGSFQEIIDQREYLKEPILRLVERIAQRLMDYVPKAFHSNPPKNENDFNEKVNALLSSDNDKWKREFPAFSFALATTVSDHSLDDTDLLIESKYVRGKTSPSKITDGIAADLTKYPDRSHKLFIVYDPERQIRDDEQFRHDFERKGKCSVRIIR